MKYGVNDLQSYGLILHLKGVGPLHSASNFNVAKGNHVRYLVDEVSEI